MTIDAEAVERVTNAILNEMDLMDGLNWAAANRYAYAAIEAMDKRELPKPLIVKDDGSIVELGYEEPKAMTREESIEIIVYAMMDGCPIDDLKDYWRVAHKAFDALIAAGAVRVK